MNMVNEDSLISVIVPVYKVEDYLDECVKSILNQTYKKLEIILVDDGSPDRCGEMCDQYAKQDARIKVIHKKNGGLSDARNAGKKVAVGNYITYVDSDDIVSVKYIERMYEIAKRYNADTIQINYTKNIETLGKIDDEGIVVLSHDEAVRNILHMKDIKEASCCKLYSREVAEKVDFPVGRLYEDVLTAYQFVYYSKIFICDTNSNLYYYRPNPNGIMHKKLSETRFSVLSVIDDLKAFLKDDYGKYENDCSYYAMRHMINVYNECIVEGGFEEFSDIMKKLRVDLINNQKHGKWRDLKYKIMISIMRISPNSYKLLIKKLRERWK